MDLLRPHDAALERLRALHPSSIDLSLGRIETLLAAVGDPHDHLPPVIHVAGTNGKGSTVAFLRAIAEAAGLKVHVFTSPHLVRFVERIRLAGTLITEEALADVLERLERANAGAPITFFEITTAAALLAFAETPADLCLVEVGLGGKFDATNVFERPALSVIAPVDIDHREFLGDTIPVIAAEKAGIIKPGGRVVVGRQAEAALEVIEATAERMGASSLVMGRDFDAWADRGGLAFQDADGLLDLPAPGLPGPHQTDNAGLSVAAARALGDSRITPEAIAEGLRRVVWPARLQRLTKGPLAALAEARGSDLWLDGGHNPHAGRALAQALAGLQARDGRPNTLLVGMLANKDASGFFAPFAALKPRVITLHFEAERAASAVALARSAAEHGLEAETCADIDEALALALAAEGPAPRVTIAGSLHLAGEALARSPETWPT